MDLSCNFFEASLMTIVVGTLASWVLWTVFKRNGEEKRIQALGGHTRYITTYAPFSLDMIIRMVIGTIRRTSFESWRDLFASYGRGGWTMETRILGQRTIFTADVENIKFILNDRFSDYGKGDSMRQQWKEFLGDHSLFTADGHPWREGRKLMRLQFRTQQFSDLKSPRKHIESLLRNIANGGTPKVLDVAADGLAQGRVLNIHDQFTRYTLDSMTEFLFGCSVNSLSSHEQKFATALTEVQHIQTLIVNCGPLSWLVPRGKFRKGLKVINGFCETYIAKALDRADFNCTEKETEEETKEKTKEEKKEEPTFLDALVSSNRDPQVLRDQLIALLLAGRDTTASTLSWTFYELARHPEVFAKLKEEITDTIGTGDPTYEVLKRMTYLKWVIAEVLRMYPGIAFNIRFALKDTELPSGGGKDGTAKIGVCKGTPIIFSPLLVHRREDLYPSDGEPGNFCPERWDKWRPKPWQYIPFSGGPRLCVGQEFAQALLSYTIVRIVQRFDRLETFMPKGNPVLKTEFALESGEGVHVAFWETAKP